MAFRFYAVRIGRKPGIYTNYQGAKSNTHKISGAQMKGFNDRNKAQAWIDELAKKPKHRDLNDRDIVAYTDGSHNKSKGIYGSGVVIMRRDKIIAEISIMGNEPTFLKSNQAPGELFAILHALQWAIDNKCGHITIRHDFSTASKIAQGLCKATAPVSREYSLRYTGLAKIIGDNNIVFEKVKAHSGDVGNARADRLARIACGK